jgi:hypothetical protein
MPKWWNKQQVCGTYTREAHTIGARTGEKGVHGKEGHARGARKVTGRHARGACMETGDANGDGGRAWQGGGGHGQGCGKGGRARQWGMRSGGVHGQGAHTCMSLVMAAALRHVVGVGCICARPSLGARTGGTNGGHAGLQVRAYICFALLI